MIIRGAWHTFEDGESRPVVRAEVGAAGGGRVEEIFLIDTGADRTAFAAALLDRLRLPGRHSPSGLTGIGGSSDHVLLDTTLALRTVDERRVRLHGTFAAFTNPATVDTSILGRDVLDHFDLIVSRRRNEVLLLARTHGYRVEQG